MVHWLTDAMVYLGAGLMVFNIYGFVKYARRMKSRSGFGEESSVLYVPIFLLLMFLLGYLLIGLFGKPDFLVGGILLGGSVFVLLVYLLLNRITNQVIENEHLEAKLMAAEESNREKNDFLASVSHEMRTPMNVILGIQGIALKNPALPPETKEQLEKIGRSGRHLLGLINNVLEMQTIETGKIAAKQEPFSLRDALEQVNAIADTLCEEKKLTYHTSLQGEIPEKLTGDETLLKQALLNLLDNAVKFTDAPGSIAFTVERLPSDEEKCLLKFCVRDTGVGMSPEFLPSAFDLFAQEDVSFTNRFGGSGLGLPSAKNKIELMGGAITAESEKNVGSVFTVMLPLGIALDEKDESPDGAARDDITLAGRRVLIVEDVAENAEIVADLLEMEDVFSEHAENGQAAVDMFSQAECGYYDAVLMDLRMPVMDGLESARRIRALDRTDAKTVPIIALTANAFETDVQHTMEAGMNAHLVKPVEAEDLYRALKHWIQSAKTGGGK